MILPMKLGELNLSGKNGHFYWKMQHFDSGTTCSYPFWDLGKHYWHIYTNPV